ncbi:protoheme ferro-lyase [Chryseobacterium ginsenosidimutans]|nr:protoheme ferro-lyase [Chryseobacterium ginsenosidimutans]
MKGILLVNLGSPRSTAVKDVKEYLDEFLMDEKVIDYRWIFRALLVRGIILNTRPAKSAEAYKTVWTDEGFSSGCYYQTDSGKTSKIGGCSCGNRDEICSTEY